MSFNYKPLSITTGEEVEKPEPPDDVGPAVLPQNPSLIPLETNQNNQNNTPNYGVQATPIKPNEINDNKDINNVIVSPPKTVKVSPPKGLTKAKVLCFILFGICLIDILVHIIMKIKSSLNIATDVLNMIYSIILLILFYLKINLDKTPIMVLVILMLIITGLVGSFGFVNSFTKALDNDDTEKHMEVEDEMILFLIFFSTSAIRMCLVGWLMFLYKDDLILINY